MTRSDGAGRDDLPWAISRACLGRRSATPRMTSSGSRCRSPALHAHPICRVARPQASSTTSSPATRQAWTPSTTRRLRKSLRPSPPCDGLLSVANGNTSRRSVLATCDEVTYKDRLHDAMGSALGIARSAQDTAETYASRLAESLASTRRSLLEGAHDLRDSGSDALAGVAGGARQAGNRFADGADAARGAGSDMLSSVMDSPIILGALGLGIGALLGALVPQTEAEEKALGGVAGQARTALRDVTQDIVDRGGAVAQRALDAGRESGRLGRPRLPRARLPRSPRLFRTHGRGPCDRRHRLRSRWRRTRTALCLAPALTRRACAASTRRKSYEASYDPSFVVWKERRR